ncbi:MAG: YabP/YqfC family sporulation protein [Clostridia bacterium]|nr:YabP/YqfC family sporulation protein [Clostridia bacterium]
MSKHKHRPLQYLSNALELPEGLLSGGAHLELRSNREAVIDGKCTVLEYDDSKIKINTGSGIIKFCGRNLSICSLCSDSAIIRGFICTIDFTD